jgi:hypothetical protein
MEKVPSNRAGQRDLDMKISTGKTPYDVAGLKYPWAEAVKNALIAVSKVLICINGFLYRKIEKPEKTN